MKLEDDAILAMKKTLFSEQLTVNSRSNDTIEDIEQYVKGYHVIFGSMHFHQFLRKTFNENEGTKDAVKRLVYRYIHFQISLP
jgi:hypothetical protein